MGASGLCFTAGPWDFHLPFSPNVPDIEGCSPVNFLGVFCFRPGSEKKKDIKWSTRVYHYPMLNFVMLMLLNMYAQM